MVLVFDWNGNDHSTAATTLDSKTNSINQNRKTNHTIEYTNNRKISTVCSVTILNKNTTHKYNYFKINRQKRTVKNYCSAFVFLV